MNNNQQQLNYGGILHQCFCYIVHLTTEYPIAIILTLVHSYQIQIIYPVYRRTNFMKNILGIKLLNTLINIYNI